MKSLLALLLAGTATLASAQDLGAPQGSDAPVEVIESAADDGEIDPVPSEGELIDGEAVPVEGAVVPAEGEDAPAAAEEGAAPAETAPAAEEAPVEEAPAE